MLDVMSILLLATTVLAISAAAWFWWQGRSVVQRRESELNEAHEAEMRHLREQLQREIDLRKRAFAGKREKFEQYRRMLDDHRERVRTGRYTRRAVEAYLEMYEEITSERVPPDDAEVLYGDVIEMLNVALDDNREIHESIRGATIELKLFVGEAAHERLVEVEDRIHGDFAAADALLTSLIEYVPDDIERDFKKNILAQQQAIGARSDVFSDVYIDLMSEFREELNRA